MEPILMSVGQWDKDGSDGMGGFRLIASWLLLPAGPAGLVSSWCRSHSPGQDRRIIQDKRGISHSTALPVGHAQETEADRRHGRAGSGGIDSILGLIQPLAPMVDYGFHGYSRTGKSWRCGARIEGRHERPRERTTLPKTRPGLCPRSIGYLSCRCSVKEAG